MLIDSDIQSNNKRRTYKISGSGTNLNKYFHNSILSQARNKIEEEECSNSHSVANESSPPSEFSRDEEESPNKNNN